MTNITIEYEIDEKTIAERMIALLQDEIHDGMCDELNYMGINVDHVCDKDFDKILTAVTK